MTNKFGKQMCLNCFREEAAKIDKSSKRREEASKITKIQEQELEETLTI